MSAKMTAEHTCKTHWLNEGIRQLDVLYRQAQEFADADDILPSENTKTSVVSLMQEFQSFPAPGIALTANGDIVLSWDNNGDPLSACINADGSCRFYHMKSLVDKSTFANNLKSAPA